MLQIFDIRTKIFQGWCKRCKNTRETSAHRVQRNLKYFGRLVKIWQCPQTTKAELFWVLRRLGLEAPCELLVMRHSLVARIQVYVKFEGSRGCKEGEGIEDQKIKGPLLIFQFSDSFKLVCFILIDIELMFST